ncbi:HAMP domain-containing sensor histidine kinase [Chitinophaga sp.]|uniref:sensor histidine kinase n=1 Tax=Chitinophaga sp. TaxID=1869181 RepID=UPI002639BBD4|nr:HAMP domain-containing sensor histidine kinase [uncultured Chitinophaga sp.]
MKPNQSIRVSHMLRGIEDPVLIISSDKLIVLNANRKAIDTLTNGKASQLRGLPLQTAYGNERPEAFPKPLPTAFMLPVSQNGDIALINFRVSPLKIEGKKYWLAIGRKVEQEEELQKRLQDLEQEKSLQQMKVQFMSMTSHEFRTPLTAISSAMDLLEARLELDGQLSSFHRLQLRKMADEIFQLNSMLDEVLTLSRMAGNNWEPDRRPVAPEQIIEALRYQYFSQRKDERSLLLSVEGEPRPVLADRDQLAKVFTNLISNAFKYSTQKNPSVKLLYKKKKLVITFRDHGIGIPESDLPHLFTSFYRGSNVDGIEGTGLGLSIVKTFVESNRGTISVSSGVNEGTTFTLVFEDFADAI